MRPRRRTQRGAAALEFGLVAPVLILMIFGIIQYGYLYWSLQTASAVARETARLLVVGTDQGCAQARAVSFASSPAVGSAPPGVVVAYRDAAGTAQAGPVQGSLVTVTVSFQSLDIGLPFLPVPDGGQVEGVATARIENVPPVALPCT